MDKEEREKEQKRLEWKEKFENWWAERCLASAKSIVTEDNPYGVAIGCLLNPDDNLDGQRRYVVE